MNFNDLKKTAAEKDKPSQQNIATLEVQALKENAALRDLDKSAQEALKQAEIILLTKALAISNENYNSFKREQDMVIKSLQEKINFLTESNLILEKGIKSEISKTQTAANQVVTSLKDQVMGEMTRETNRVFSDMRTIANQAAQYYNNRQTLDSINFVFSVFSAISTAYLVIKFF